MQCQMAQNYGIAQIADTVAHGVQVKANAQRATHCENCRKSSVIALFFRVTQMTHMFVFIETEEKRAKIPCMLYATQNSPKIGLFRSWKPNKSVAFFSSQRFLLLLKWSSWFCHKSDRQLNICCIGMLFFQIKTKYFDAKCIYAIWFTLALPYMQFSCCLTSIECQFRATWANRLFFEILKQ